MKKNNILYGFLFLLLMGLLWLPLLQEHFGCFQFEPLNGVFEPTELPELTLDNYADGKWQRQVEPYIGEHFGFREPLIRLYNQYVYDFYNKTYSNEIAVGKDGWLYQKDGVIQYFGHKGEFHGLTNEQFMEKLDLEIRSLVKIRAILKEYDVELMTFTLPVKSYVYPEHLRPQPFGDTTFNANDYYDQKLNEVGFPHINMTPWFQKIRNDYPFTLFYEKGGHWASGAVIATDSLLRYMETLKGEHFPQIVMGEPYEVPKDQVGIKNNDLGELLNLCRQPRQHLPLYEFPVSIVADSTSVHPSVLFSGTSYYWHIVWRIPLREVFSNRDFMYYNMTYFNNEETTWRKMEQVSTMRELLLHDYIVTFRNTPQLYSDDFAFSGKALIGLCISDERLQEKTEQLTDSLMQATADIHPNWKREHYRYAAQLMLIKNPELFEELRGEAVPTSRNPKIDAVLKERIVRSDRDWRFILYAQACNDTVDIDNLYQRESYHLLNGTPLLKSQPYFTTYNYFEFLLEEIRPLFSRPDNDMAELNLLALETLNERMARHEYDNDSLLRAACRMDAVVKSLENEQSLASIREKARDRGCSIDKMFSTDVLWCYNNLKTAEYGEQDWERLIATAFELYKIERGLRKDPPTMEKVRQKCLERQIPFRAAIDDEVRWIYQNKK